MTKIEIVAAAWALFQTHKTEDKVFAASDGTLFFAKNHAESHAGGLEKKDLFEIDRDTAEAAKQAGLLDKDEDPAEEEDPEPPGIPTTKIGLEDLKESPSKEPAQEPQKQEEPKQDPTLEQKPTTETTKKGKSNATGETNTKSNPKD